MNFQISGLDEKLFQHLYGLAPEELARHGIERMTVESKPGYPCRVALEDADIGDSVLLLNFEHLPGPSPYRSSHAIFVKDGARKSIIGRNEIPDLMRIRLLSVRAFDAQGMMLDAEVVAGKDLEPVIQRLLSAASVDFLHVHNAGRGCYIARVDRA